MKYKQDLKSLFLTLLGLFLIFVILTFFTNFNFQTMKVSSNFIFYSILLLFSFGTYFFVICFFTYYKIENKKFIIKKTFTKKEIPFNDIIFIDDTKIKKGIIYLHLKNKARIILTTSKKSTLYKDLLKKCKKLKTKEEFEALFS